MDEEMELEFVEVTKVSGQNDGRLAFEQLFGPPQIDAITLTLMQKAASVSDLELFRAAELVCPESPMALYEEMGGGFKLAGSFDRAKGIKRVGELLSGSRAKALGKAKDEAAGEAARHLSGAVRHDPSKVTPRILKAVHTNKVDKLPNKDREVARHAESAHKNITSGRRAERLGKVMSAEESKVRAARIGAGAAGAAAIAGGVAAARGKDSSKK